MTELYILRHGNTFNKGDAVRRIGARTDMPLSASGVMQATRTAGHFEKLGVAFEHVVSSPLERAMMTADIVAAGVFAEPLPFLTEIDYGPDEGQPEEAVVARIGEEALKNWDENAVPPSGWIVDPAGLAAEWKAFFAECAGLEGPILAVTSNGIARFALDAADKVSGDFPRKLSTCAWGRVLIDADGRAEIKSWNERAD
jgi:broad specificity phosphatase PhoE